MTCNSSTCAFPSQTVSIPVLFFNDNETRALWLVWLSRLGRLNAMCSGEHDERELLMLFSHYLWTRLHAKSGPNFPSKMPSVTEQEFMQTVLEIYQGGACRGKYEVKN